MSTIKVVSMTGAEVGTVELNDAIFGVEPNMSVVHEVVKNHLANCRQGTQSALTRAEVSGGGRKPWRQKGTGRARQGSTRSPQWTHGGIAFAPKPRTYSYPSARRRSSPCAFTPARPKWRSPVRSASARRRCPAWRKMRSARSARTSFPHKPPPDAID